MTSANRGRSALRGFLVAIKFAAIVGLAGGAWPAKAAQQSLPDAMLTAAAGTATPAPPSVQSAPASPKPAESPPDAPTNAGSAQIINIEARPMAMISGKAKWDDGLNAIMDSEKKLNAAVGRAGLKATGHPQTLFTQTDDNGFTYEAMVPLAEKPEGKVELGDDVKIGSSPAGKAIKFQYHGPYDDIDSTYDLITAYLDEKDLEAQDYFIEEYMTDPKGADDPNLAVDIYIYIK